MKDEEPFEIQACRDFLEAHFAYKRGERDVVTAMMFAKAEWKAIIALKIWNQRKAASKSIATRVSEWLRRTDPPLPKEGTKR